MKGIVIREKEYYFFVKGYTMLPYTLMTCDMDGTLLSDDATICTRNIQTIQQAIRAGLHFVPCTGRGFESLNHIQETLGNIRNRENMSFPTTALSLPKTAIMTSCMKTDSPGILPALSMTLAWPTISQCTSTHMARCIYIITFPLNGHFSKDACPT